MSDVVTIIEARPQTLVERLRAVWKHRGFYPLLMREISLRKFDATLFGFWWLVIRPLIPTAVAVISFTFFVPINTKGMPYPIFYFSGFLAWNLFHATIQFMPRTMTWMRSMMRKVYFPKLLVPLASVGPPLLEFGIVFVMFAITLIAFYLHSGILYLVVGWNLLILPPVLLLALVLAVSIGMITSMMALYVRDIVFSVGYFAQIAMLVTPVLYPISSIPQHLHWIIFAFNPMAAVVETSRWCLTGQGEFLPFWLLLSTLEIGGIAAICVLFFLRAETYLADAI